MSNSFIIQIVRKLLDYFSTQEILLFSLVNPIWNIEAKSLLKVRGGTGARMGMIKPQELVRSIGSPSDELREEARRAESENVADEDAGASFVGPLRNWEANACEDVMNFARLNCNRSCCWNWVFRTVRCRVLHSNS